MAILDMVRLSVLVRAQEKPEKLGNRRDDAEEGDHQEAAELPVPAYDRIGKG